MSDTTSDSTTRRVFLGAATAAAAMRVWGANDRINQAIVGLGGRGTAHLKTYAKLPGALPDGKVSGLVGRGGFAVAITWKSGKLVTAVVTASQSKPLKVRYAGQEIQIQAKAAQTYTFGPDLKTL